MSDCSELTSYLLGELSEEDERMFISHVEQCPDCCRDLQELYPLNQRLLDSEEDELALPKDLKQRTLAAAFATRLPSNAQAKITRRWRKKWLQGLSFTAALFVGLFVGRWTMGQQASILNTDPAIMMRSVVLGTTTIGKIASGTAMVYQRGHALHLVVYTNHMPPLDDWGCYTVWGIENHKKTNLGDFMVDSSGSGALSIGLQSMGVVNTIQITHEPTWNDTSPKGQEILKVTSS